jgi:hypothetical protein
MKLLFFSRIRRRAAHHCIKKKKVYNNAELGSPHKQPRAPLVQMGNKVTHALQGKTICGLLAFQTTKACGTSVNPKLDVNLDPLPDLKNIGGEIIEEASIAFFPNIPEDEHHQGVKPTPSLFDL